MSVYSAVRPVKALVFVACASFAPFSAYAQSEVTTEPAFPPEAGALLRALSLGENAALYSFYAENSFASVFAGNEARLSALVSALEAAQPGPA